MWMYVHRHDPRRDHPVKVRKLLRDLPIIGKIRGYCDIPKQKIYQIERTFASKIQGPLVSKGRVIIPLREKYKGIPANGMRDAFRRGAVRNWRIYIPDAFRTYIKNGGKWREVISTRLRHDNSCHPPRRIGIRYYSIPRHKARINHESNQQYLKQRQR